VTRPVAVATVLVVALFVVAVGMFCAALALASFPW
jgi:hypothetical protein